MLSTMWLLFGLGAAPDRDVLRRLQDLEDDATGWERRFKKLQGAVNASVRDQVRLERENDELRDELETLDPVEQDLPLPRAAKR
jgi:regulator of replication initiation timing